MATLYIVATPIGNLQDITLRAIQVLSTIEFIACEDTRRTGQLLKHIGVNQNPTLVSYFEHNEEARMPQILNILTNGKDVALVSDAGTPTISDPGYKLVRECISLGFKVESIPGPSAVISALVASGLPTDKFLYLGYLPHKPGNRKRILESVRRGELKKTVILFIAPHKLIKTLEELNEVFGDINIVVCRELTKVHEEIRREKISESLAHFQNVHPKGEFVLLFHYGEAL